ncbi:proteasome subunit beta type-10 isoform X1 [Dasypus novemcinctus]|uniref:proteasome subunit beta type-10 isoform X1 n=1 Tax=Dasypus novemcinctus TaxID=9361 RepID=UPI000328E87F|nr:proteasome subunit beta type-10 isoform X1 [Dasypus novemcinctus]XP_058135811.1 proteasome subunit beta type-10 isoform X1 [Dasypus novemcinctus]
MHLRPGLRSLASCSETGSSWVQIRGPLTTRSWRTRAARRFTSSPPKSSEDVSQPRSPSKNRPSGPLPAPAHPSPAHGGPPFALSCCGAGVAADAEMTTRMAASNMELHALSTGREPRVATVTRVLRQTLFRYRGHVGASLIVGGVDVTGPQLYSVHPHGSYSRLPFAALGSGQDAALAVLEDRFQPNMTLEAAQELLVEAITAGILGDLGSGGNVDACVITGTGAKLLRTLSSPTEPVKRQGGYHFAPGTTAVLTQTVMPLSLELLEETVQVMEVE